MISVCCLVDNKAQRGSALWAEHGLSISIEISGGKLLYDTGQSGEVLVHNAAQLGISLELFDALALSHAHYDHTGGLEHFLTLSKPGIPLYAHPDLLQERFSIKDGLPRSIGLRLSPIELSQKADLRLSKEPQQILPGLWTSGQISTRNDLEGRSSHHYIRENGQWLPDPYLDDLALVLEARDGLVVICGCCHAGLLNTLTHVRRHFSDDIQAIIGGLHLLNFNAKNLQHIISNLEEMFAGRIPQIYPNHCSGERAFSALQKTFKDSVHPFPTGTLLNFL
jgi:7,8-dihydropterin-6-yl-methyl-4-(beta-D-ribofuranosyl)aminobenzene 5'-phosphate synthase